MSKPPRPFTKSGQAAPPVEQQRLIAEQTEAFLRKGNQIQKIPRGVSGQNFGVPRTPAAATQTSKTETT